MKTRVYLFTALITGMMIAFSSGCGSVEELLDEWSGISSSSQRTEKILLSSTRIGSEGGVLAADGFKLTIPSGMFSEETELTLYEVEGETHGFSESLGSKVYRVEGLPDSLPSLPWPDMNVTGEGNGYIVAAFKAFVPSTSEEGWGYAVKNSGTVKRASAALISDDKGVGSPRATEEKSENSLNLLDYFYLKNQAVHKTDHFSIYYSRYGAGADDVESLGDDLEEAYDTYSSMGFDYSRRTEWPVEVFVKKLDRGTYGLFTKTTTSASLLRTPNYSAILFNKDYLDRHSALRVTAGHEFFHFVQNLYDPRYGEYFKSTFGVELHWLNEACAVWSEEMFSDNPDYVSEVFKTAKVGLFEGVNNTANDMEVAGMHGYGMAPFIKYLVGKYGKSIVLDIYLEILNGKSPVDAINKTTDYHLVLDYELALRQWMTGGIYHQKKQEILDQTDSVVQLTKKENSKRFRQGYFDLSAQTFRIRSLDSTVGENTVLNLSVDQRLVDITVFTVTDKIEFLDHSASKTLTVPNVKKYAENGTELIVMVTNSNFTGPHYDHWTTITLDMNLTDPGTVVLDADPSSIKADGKSTTTITATVSDKDGNPLKDGTVVTFTTTAGRLSASSAVVSNGQAVVQLTSSTDAGRAEVDAEAGEVSGKIIVEFTALTCRDDQYQCPDCGTSQILKYHNDGSGYCVATNIDTTNDRVCDLAYDGFGYQIDTNGDPKDDTYISCLYGFDGKLDWQEPYIDGKKDGTALGFGFYEEGVLHRIITYDRGDVVSDCWYPPSGEVTCH